MQIFQRIRIHIDHVSGLVIAESSDLMQVGRQAQMVHFIFRGKEQRRQIIIAAIEHGARNFGLSLHHLGQIGHHIGAARRELAPGGR